MAEYTYDDLITAKDVATGKVKTEDIIGKKGWFFNGIPLDMSLNVIVRGAKWHGVLENYDEDRAYPFEDVNDTGYAYFLPEKEESAPDKPEYTNADIISDPYDPRLEGAIGKLVYSADYQCELLHFANDHCRKSKLLGINSDYTCPFRTGASWRYIIIAKEQPEYIPFDLSLEEDRAKLRDKWIKCDKEESKITGFALYDNGEWDIELPNGYLDPKEMLALWTFLDGSPCGKLVEVENE